MSDLTKALMGYEETQYGFVNPDAVDACTPSIRKECPYPSDVFAIDAINGVVIIPTPNGNAYHDESVDIDFNQFVPELALGNRKLRKDNNKKGFELSIPVFCSTATLTKSFMYDEVPFVDSIVTVLTLEQWQQLLNSFANQYNEAVNDLLLSVETIENIADIYFSYKNYNLYRFYLYNLKKSNINNKKTKDYEIFTASLYDRFERLVVLYHRAGGDVNSTDFLDFIEHAVTADNCYSQAIINAWFGKTDLQTENAKIKALHEAYELMSLNKNVKD